MASRAASSSNGERLYVATPADLESFGAPAGWGAVAAQLQGKSWTVRRMAGGTFERIDAMRAGARLVLFDRAALSALACALDTAIGEADCDFVDDRIDAPSLAAAAVSLLPAGSVAIDPDTAALLLMELFGVEA
jgi:hypothetical protein